MFPWPPRGMLCDIPHQTTFSDDYLQKLTSKQTYKPSKTIASITTMSKLLDIWANVQWKKAINGEIWCYLVTLWHLSDIVRH
jgi:hypothetical protein